MVVAAAAAAAAVVSVAVEIVVVDRAACVGKGKNKGRGKVNKTTGYCFQPILFPVQYGQQYVALHFFSLMFSRFANVYVDCRSITIYKFVCLEADDAIITRDINLGKKMRTATRLHFLVTAKIKYQDQKIEDRSNDQSTTMNQPSNNRQSNNQSINQSI